MIGHRSSVLKDAGNEAAGLDEVREIRTFSAVYRGRDGHNEEIGLLECRGIIGKRELRDFEGFRRDLSGAIVSRLKLPNATMIDVKANSREDPAEGGGQRQPHVAQSDHSYAFNRWRFVGVHRVCWACWAHWVLGIRCRMLGS